MPQLVQPCRDPGLSVTRIQQIPLRDDATKYQRGHPSEAKDYNPV
jgi:hypothetical protein